MGYDIASVLTESSRRGYVRGLGDVNVGAYNPAPLDGQWSGESVEELLGDLIRETEAIYREENGMFEDDPMFWSDVANMSALSDDVCEAYERGYLEAWGNDVPSEMEW